MAANEWMISTIWLYYYLREDNMPTANCSKAEQCRREGGNIHFWHEVFLISCVCFSKILPPQTGLHSTIKHLNAAVNPHLRITAQTCGWWSGPRLGTVPGAGGPGRRGNACAGYWQRLSGTGLGTVGGSGRLISFSVWALVLRKRVVACSVTVRETDTKRRSQKLQQQQSIWLKESGGSLEGALSSGVVDSLISALCTLFTSDTMTHTAIKITMLLLCC